VIISIVVTTEMSAIHAHNVDHDLFHISSGIQNGGVVQSRQAEVFRLILLLSRSFPLALARCIFSQVFVDLVRWLQNSTPSHPSRLLSLRFIQDATEVHSV
jgi:hypothetical protein